MKLHVRKQEKRFIIDNMEITVQNMEILEVVEEDLTARKEITIHNTSLVTIKGCL